MPEYRKGLPSRPERMTKLKLDARGYPVPYFVEWINGEPEFRAMNMAKFKRCIEQKLCWLCGEKLGRFMTFVVGPMCAINRASAEPPSHLECARYSATACPFLILPKSKRNEAGLDELGAKVPGGEMIRRNPGVVLLWTTRDYEVARLPNGHIVQMGEPTELNWYAEGRVARPEEVDASISSGLPILEDMAAKDGQDALDELAQRHIWVRQQLGLTA